MTFSKADYMKRLQQAFNDSLPNAKKAAVQKDAVRQAGVARRRRKKKESKP